jgi:hypothetical protein
MLQPFHDTDESQGLQTVIDLWESEFLPRLPAHCVEQAYALQAFERARQIRSPTDLLRGLFAYVLTSCSWRTVSCWATIIGLAEMSDRAWAKRLNQALPWLQWMLDQLLASPDVASLLPEIPCDVRILLIDASTLKQPGGTGDDWRLHLAYDLLRGAMAEVRVTDKHGAESLAPFHLRKNDVVVSDRGYGYRKNIAAAETAQAKSLFRFSPSTLPLQQEDGTPLQVITWLKEQGEGTHECQAICQDAKHRYRVRVLAQSLPPEQAEKARAKRKEEARRHGRKIQEETLYLAGWLLLVTTLDASVWDSVMTIRLYRARWQIELIFKRMKSILKLGQLRSIQPQTVHAHLTTLLVAWALQENVAQQLRGLLQALPEIMVTSALPASASDPNEEPESTPEGEQVLTPAISSWMLICLSIQTLRQMVLGQWSIARLHEVLPRLQRFLRGSPRRRLHQESHIRASLVALMTHERGAFCTFSSA